MTSIRRYTQENVSQLCELYNISSSGSRSSRDEDQNNKKRTRKRIDRNRGYLIDSFCRSGGGCRMNRLKLAFLPSDRDHLLTQHQCGG